MNELEKKMVGFIAAKLYRLIKDDDRFSLEETDSLYYIACSLGGFDVDTDIFDEL